MTDNTDLIFQYDSEYGGQYTLKPYLGIYANNENLCLGFNYLDNEDGKWYPFCYATVNTISLAYLEGTIDVNDNGMKMLDFLEKNGFVYTNNHTLKGADTYICRYKDYKLIYKLGDYFAVDSYDDRYYRLFETQFCHKWSVHELQHALRLCGIDKEIAI